jgi:hypothetical protein
MLNFARGPFFIYWDNHLTFVIYLSFVVYHVYWFEYFKLYLSSINERNLSMWNLLKYVVELELTVFYWQIFIYAHEKCYIKQKNGFIYNFGQNWEGSHSQSAFPIALSQFIEGIEQTQEIFLNVLKFPFLCVIVYIWYQYNTVFIKWYRSICM